MKTLIASALTAAFLIGGCATAESSNGASSSPAAKSSKEDYVTGSRIPRSDNNENFQGAKSMTGKDYREYKQSEGLNSK